MKFASRRLLTISLPAEMAQQLEAARKVEFRSRSEFVREALRYYLQRPMRVEEQSPTERRAIARGRGEIGRGRYVTLSALLHELETPSRRLRPKASSAPARS